MSAVSGLYALRMAMRDKLLEDGLWEKGEILIRRRADFWNDVAVMTQASRTGQCLTIGEAKGQAAPGQKSKSKQVKMVVTIALNLIELPQVTDDLEASDEDARWEATVLRLIGDPLGREKSYYSLDFDGFDEVPDDQYVIRQTTFRTEFLLKRKSDEEIGLMGPMGPMGED
jgi:hypothetical protein